jgi:glyoxylase-like metal-dependent hydrolase (beta-lactamase superfamily II)
MATQMPTAEPAPNHPEIVRLVAPNPGPMTLNGTNTYVVGEDPAYVIDPGPEHEGHVAVIRAEAERRGGLGGILLTHAHADHAAAAWMLGGAIVQSGPFRSIPTPGHSEDHVCFLLDGVCFTGDLILGEGSTFVPPTGGSLASYLDSLHRVAELDIELMCPGHGPFVTDPASKVREYIEHRMERERRLVEALERGERSRAKLIDEAWSDVPDEMRPAAAVVMQAHLEKLESEGNLPDDLTD